MLIDKINEKEINIVEAFAFGREVFKGSKQEIINIIFIFGLPISILLGLSTTMVGNAVGTVDFEALASSTTAFNQFMESGRWQALIIYNCLILLIQSTIVPLITMAIAKITSDYVYGKNVKESKAIRLSFEKGAILIIAGILHSVLSTIGFAFLFIPGIYLYISFMFFVYAIVLDDKGVIGSLKYSRFLVKGYFFKTLITALVLYSISYMLSAFSSMIFMSFPNNSITNTMYNFMVTGLQTFFTVGVTIYYINRRGLKEKKVGL